MATKHTTTVVRKAGKQFPKILSILSFNHSRIAVSILFLIFPAEKAGRLCLFWQNIKEQKMPQINPVG
ncbi:MAG: hypothetical protein DRJ05_03090 [Bacteroidetes bacterium]|nr:MAG: hypothetical protein DRJ05_03090 [Bacteroidota bacterium]